MIEKINIPIEVTDEKGHMFGWSEFTPPETVHTKRIST